ncbi:hypothetical protein SDC9_204717 [bioreactor metagenome]|uniref:RNA polymerase sigma factor 70 region 4 type 2 domain-containing protein n=1 Tax=bioreactor metagenome TaxID=1076179 RepID=A0A645JBV9_9ZZZZ
MEENGVSNELENDFDNKLIWQEDMESLKNAICKLPQNQKDLLYFKYILEMSDDEIANVLGIAPNSIRQYLTRARRNAKAFIDRGVCNDVK